MRPSGPPSRALRVAVCGLLVVLSGAFASESRADVTAAPADPTASQPAAETPPPPVAKVPEAMRSPRAVLEAFISLMREDKKKSAAKLLDLSELAAIAAESRGPDLSLKLYQLVPALGEVPAIGEDDLARALDWRTKESGAQIDFSRVPEKSDTPAPWPLTEWLLTPKEGAEKLLLARDLDGRWRFSTQTVAAIDPLYEASEEVIDEKTAEKASSKPAVGVDEVAEPTVTYGVWLRKLFPQEWRKTYFLLPSYQWLLLVLLAPLGRIAEKLTRGVLTALGDWLFGRIDPAFVEARESTAKVWRPVGRLAAAAVWVIGAYTIDIPSGVINVLLPILTIVTIVAVVLALFRVLDLIAGYMTRRAERRNRKFDHLIVPLITSTAKIGVVLASVIAAVAVFSEKLPSTLIGGLGIGGIAIALASQETLSNFFGSLTLLFDRPFEVGDWINIEGVEGEVERLGFRSTRIRTGLNSQVTVPNSKLASANVDNLGRRKYRRYLNRLGLEYGTPPDRIEAFCEGVRELIRRHPHTRKDFYAAYFNDFGATSLDVLVVAYFEVPDWATELQERHRLLADILRLADSVGVVFAFPTQTLHLHRGEGPGVPPELADDEPDLAGAIAAAKIAGELPNYQDRPGKVKFPGPTQIDEPERPLG